MKQSSSVQQHTTSSRSKLHIISNSSSITRDKIKPSQIILHPKLKNTSSESKYMQELPTINMNPYQQSVQIPIKLTRISSQETTIILNVKPQKKKFVTLKQREPKHNSSSYTRHRRNSKDLLMGMEESDISSQLPSVRQSRNYNLTKQSVTTLATSQVKDSYAQYSTIQSMTKPPRFKPRSGQQMSDLHFSKKLQSQMMESPKQSRTKMRDYSNLSAKLARQNDYDASNNIIYDSIDENSEIIMNIGRRQHRLQPLKQQQSKSQTLENKNNFSYQSFLTDLKVFNTSNQTTPSKIIGNQENVKPTEYLPQLEEEPAPRKSNVKIVQMKDIQNIKQHNDESLSNHNLLTETEDNRVALPSKINAQRDSTRIKSQQSNPKSAKKQHQQQIQPTPQTIYQQEANQEPQVEQMSSANDFESYQNSRNPSKLEVFPEEDEIADESSSHRMSPQGQQVIEEEIDIKKSLVSSKPLTLLGAATPSSKTKKSERYLQRDSSRSQISKYSHESKANQSVKSKPKKTILPPQQMAQNKKQSLVMNQTPFFIQGAQSKFVKKSDIFIHVLLGKFNKLLLKYAHMKFHNMLKTNKHKLMTKVVLRKIVLIALQAYNKYKAQKEKSTKLKVSTKMIYAEIKAAKNFQSTTKLQILSSKDTLIKFCVALARQHQTDKIFKQWQQGNFMKWCINQVKKFQHQKRLRTMSKLDGLIYWSIKVATKFQKERMLKAFANKGELIKICVQIAQKYQKQKVALMWMNKGNFIKQCVSIALKFQKLKKTMIWQNKNELIKLCVRESIKFQKLKKTQIWTNKERLIKMCVQSALKFQKQKKAMAWMSKNNLIKFCVEAALKFQKLKRTVIWSNKQELIKLCVKSALDFQKLKKTLIWQNKGELIKLCVREALKFQQIKKARIWTNKGHLIKMCVQSAIKFQKQKKALAWMSKDNLIKFCVQSALAFQKTKKVQVWMNKDKLIQLCVQLAIKFQNKKKADMWMNKDNLIKMCVNIALKFQRQKRVMTFASKDNLLKFCVQTAIKFMKIKKLKSLQSKDGMISFCLDIFKQYQKTKAIQKWFNKDNFIKQCVQICQKFQKTKKLRQVMNKDALIKLSIKFYQDYQRLKKQRIMASKDGFFKFCIQVYQNYKKSKKQKLLTSKDGFFKFCIQVYQNYKKLKKQQILASKDGFFKYCIQIYQNFKKQKKQKLLTSKDGFFKFCIKVYLNFKKQKLLASKDGFFNFCIKVYQDYKKKKAAQKWSNKKEFTAWCLEVVRERIRTNKNLLLNKIVHKRLIQMSIQAYQERKEKRIQTRLHLTSVLRKLLVNKQMKSLKPIDVVKVTLVDMALYEYRRMVVKRQLEDSNKFTDLCLNIFRESLRTNKKKCLSRLVSSKLVQLSLAFYFQYESAWRVEFVRQLLYRKLITMSLASYKNYRQQILQQTPPSQPEGEQDALEDMGPKINQAYLLEFETEDDLDRASNAEDEKRPSITDTQSIKRESSSSGHSNSNLIDSIVSSLYKFKDLEKANILELRQIEKKLLNEVSNYQDQILEEDQPQQEETPKHEGEDVGNDFQDIHFREQTTVVKEEEEENDSSVQSQSMVESKNEEHSIHEEQKQPSQKSSKGELNEALKLQQFYQFDPQEPASATKREKPAQLGINKELTIKKTNTLQFKKQTKKPPGGNNTQEHSMLSDTHKMQIPSIENSIQNVNIGQLKLPLGQGSDSVKYVNLDKSAGGKSEGKKSDLPNKIPKASPNKIFGISVGNHERKKFSSTSSLDQQLKLAELPREQKGNMKSLVKVLKQLDKKSQIEIFKALQPHLNSSTVSEASANGSKVEAKKKVKLRRYADFLGDNK